ncbi:hypothetical protein NC651_030878 [Populus alba x Populus x berolinensis]|nr:hypothetical protein NC651_030878 [Populus alba x Populus x berolinensis]
MPSMKPMRFLFCKHNTMHLEERRKRRRDQIISGLFHNVSYTTFISGLFQAGRVLEAKELFKDIRAQSHFPDLMTYSTLLDGLRKQGYLDQTLGLFRDMQKKLLEAS